MPKVEVPAARASPASSPPHSCHAGSRPGRPACSATRPASTASPPSPSAPRSPARRPPASSSARRREALGACAGLLCGSGQRRLDADTSSHAPPRPPGRLARWGAPSSHADETLRESVVAQLRSGRPPPPPPTAKSPAPSPEALSAALTAEGRGGALATTLNQFNASTVPPVQRPSRGTFLLNAPAAKPDAQPNPRRAPTEDLRGPRQRHAIQRRDPALRRDPRGRCAR